MRTATELTVARAWTQLLKLEDGALADLTPGRISRPDPKAKAVTFVRLLSHGVIVGPQWAIDRAADRSDHELAKLHVLQELTADHISRPLGAAMLSFTDVPIAGLPTAPTAADDATVATLEGLCLPDEVEEAGLARMPQRWVVLGSSPTSQNGKAPAASAGYEVLADVLAHLGILTAPDQRRQGHGTVAAGRAINAALVAGLLPQWRARTDNKASQQLARRLGFQPLGSQTTVLIERR